MIKVITLVPTHRNDGSPVSESEWNGIIQRFWIKFGGVTVAGQTEGHWVDPESGTLYRDVCWQVFIIIEDNLLSEAEEFVAGLGRQLGQLAMYFEVQRPDIRFLETK